MYTLSAPRLLLLLLLSFCLVAPASALLFNEEQETPKKEVVLPDPTNLQPDWWDYFDVKPDVLKKHTEKELKLLDELLSKIENPKDKEIAKSAIQEIKTRLNLILLLKKQEAKPPSLAWVPKEQYSLSEYIEISDKIRELQQRINHEKLEYNQKTGFVDDYQQIVQNAFAEYLSLPSPSKEQFLKGLDVMKKGLRAGYLEIESKFLKEKIQNNDKLLNHYWQEQGLISDRLNLKKIDLKKIAEKTAKAKSNLRKADQQLLNLENETIKFVSQENEKQMTAEVLNQKMISVLAEERLAQIQLATYQGIKTLSEISVSSKKKSYQDKLKKEQEFYHLSLAQLKRWQQTTENELDLAAKAIVIKDYNQPEKVNIHTERLQTALYNMVLMDDLSRELSHFNLILNLIDKQLPEAVSFWDRIQIYYSDSLSTLTHWFGNWTYYSLFEIGGTPITIMGIIQAIFIIFLAIFISHFSRKWLWSLAKKRGKVAEPTIYTFSRILHYTLLMLGLLIALSSLGLTMHNITIILGALGVGIGFGLQNIVNNFLCGLTVLFERNLKIGDLIELESGHFGTITEINVQNSTVHTYDGIDVIVPNSTLIGKQVINWTKRDPYLRLHVPFGVAYGTDQDLVAEVVCKVAKEVPGTIYDVKGVPEPTTWLVEFGQSSLNFELVVWVNVFKCSGRTSLKAAYLSVIEKALKEHNIVIPFPQRDLHLKSVSKDVSLKGA